jgi:hypothetical protein
MLLTEAQVRAAARQTVGRLHKSAGSILSESARADSAYQDHFDIFLSHTIKDAEIVLGVAMILVDTGKTVYVDWIVDPQLDRSNVTPETARKLRNRMNQSDSLFYIHSKQSTSSRWMPWELGYFDGHNGNVAILPVVEEATDTFTGLEYLGLYPYVDVAGITNQNRRDVFINRNPREYKRFGVWKQEADKLRPRAA